jgi:hypothetical protein
MRRVFRLGTFNDKRSGGAPSGYPSQRHLGNGYGTKNTLRSGARQRLPSNDETMVGFSESEERINRGDNWPMPKEDIVLSPMDGKLGHKTSVQVGKDGDSSDQEYDAGTHDLGITKTVQVTQYTL